MRTLHSPMSFFDPFYATPTPPSLLSAPRNDSRRGRRTGPTPTRKKRQSRKKTKTKFRGGLERPAQVAFQRVTSCRVWNVPTARHKAIHTLFSQKPTKRVPERGCSHAKLGTGGLRGSRAPHPPLSVCCRAMPHPLFFCPGRGDSRWVDGWVALSGGRL